MLDRYPSGVASPRPVRVSRRRVSVSTASPPGVNAGRETAGVKPTASAYFRYVSMEATTTRASIVIRSMPTREIRTHASITIPLSSTRSRTSIKLVPPGALSTAILVRFLFQEVYEHTRGFTCPILFTRLSTTTQTTDCDASYLLCAPHGGCLHFDSHDRLRSGWPLRVSGFPVPVRQAFLAVPRFQLRRARRVSSGWYRNATSSSRFARPYRSSKQEYESAT